MLALVLPLCHSSITPGAMNGYSPKATPRDPDDALLRSPDVTQNVTHSSPDQSPEVTHRTADKTIPSQELYLVNEFVM